MAVYISLAVITIALSLMIKENSISGTRQYALNKLAYFAIFILLFAVSMFRWAVGNDYWPYMFGFRYFAEGRPVAYEPGFKLVIKIMQFITDKNNYVSIFTLFSFLTVFFFVKAIEEQSEWASYTLFLLLANGYYYSSLNSVRYYFAFALAMWSMKYILEERHLEFLLTILVGALFHKSILIVIPVYYLCRIKWNKIGVTIVLALSASLPIFKGFYRKIFFLFYPFYEGSLFDNSEVSYVNIAKSFAVVALCIIFYKSAIKGDKRNQFFFNLNVASFLVYTCCSFLPEYTRIGYYFAGSQIFLIPSVLKRIPKKKARIFFTVAVTVCFVLYFGFFLYTCYDVNIRLLPYRNWIFQGNI